MFFSIIRRSSINSMKDLNKNFKFQEAIQYYQKELPTLHDPAVRSQMTYEYEKALNFHLLSNPHPPLPVFRTSEWFFNTAKVAKYLSSFATTCFTLAFGLFLIKSILTEETQNFADLDKPIKISTESNKTFKDVKGIDECREELEEIVHYLKNHEKYKESGAKVHKGVLLTGQPGTGKTLLAKAIAGEAGVAFLYTSGSEFDEMFYGLGSARVRRLFEQAKSLAPCIIFIDEIDSMASKRGSGDMSGSQTLNQLLIELDGFNSSENIIVIAATNIPEAIDPALKRSGRFDKVIHIMPPGLKGRKEILDFYLSKVQVSPDLDLDWLVRKTAGMTGADLANLVNIAAINAGKFNKEKLEVSDFDYAVDRVSIGIERKSFVMDKEDLMNTAYHELGHALLAYLGGAVNLHKITILPRGHSLGHTAYLPQKQHDLVSFKDIKAYICSALGGRAAEEVFMGQKNITTGCSSDLQHATRILLKGLTSGVFLSESERFTFSEKEIGDSERWHFEEAGRKILQGYYREVLEVIREHREFIEDTAKVLVENETISGQEFERRVKEWREKKGVV